MHNVGTWHAACTPSDGAISPRSAGFVIPPPVSIRICNPQFRTSIAQQVGNVHFLRITNPDTRRFKTKEHKDKRFPRSAGFVIPPPVSIRICNPQFRPSIAQQVGNVHFLRITNPDTRRFKTKEHKDKSPRSAGFIIPPPVSIRICNPQCRTSIAQQVGNVHFLRITNPDTRRFKTKEHKDKRFSRNSRFKTKEHKDKRFSRNSQFRTSIAQQVDNVHFLRITNPDTRMRPDYKSGRTF